MLTDARLFRTVIASMDEAEAATADALAALDTLPPFVRSALARTDTKQRARLGLVLPHVPTDAPLPSCLSPFTPYAAAFLSYPVSTPADLAPLLARHAPIPVAVEKDSCTSIRPASLPAKHERADVRPVSPIIVTCERTADYPHKVTVQWWTEIDPGVIVEIHAEAAEWSEIARWFRYEETTPKPHPRRDDPARTWRLSTTLPGADRINWHTGAGNPPRVTLTWPLGVDVAADALGVVA